MSKTASIVIILVLCCLVGVNYRDYKKREQLEGQLKEDSIEMRDLIMDNFQQKQRQAESISKDQVKAIIMETFESGVRCTISAMEESPGETNHSVIFQKASMLYAGLLRESQKRLDESRASTNKNAIVTGIK